MLTTEAPQYTVQGLTVFRDHADTNQYWYLPGSTARVRENGRSLSFIAYSEDITNDPNFNADLDHAGGFLSLEVELGPTQGELEEARTELAGLIGGGEPKLAQVPFFDGSVSLSILGDRGSGDGTLDTNGHSVHTVGSTKPMLLGRQQAVFSARLGGKSAEILYRSLRTNADPQAIVNYELKYRALRPAYNLEITVDFKKTFEQIRHRVGANLLLAKADLDFMIQEAVNSGSIIVKEIDFTGDASEGSPLAAEGGVMKIVRDLISPNLFNPLPIPTPNYRALPDSATSALSNDTSSPNNASTVAGESDGASQQRELSVGTDLKIQHTPVSGGHPAGRSLDISAIVSATGGISIESVKVMHRVSGADAFTALNMSNAANTPTTTTTPEGEAESNNSTTPDTTPGTEGEGPAEGAEEPVSAAEDESENPESVDGEQTSDNPPYKASISAQANGTLIEYFIEVTGKKGDETLTQTLPQDTPREKPLKVRIGTTEDTRTRLFDRILDPNNGPLIGYSLRSIDVTEQITRTFKLDKQSVETLSCFPGGMLSANRIGSQFDPDTQVTHILLGEGPFKIIVLRFSAGFDFAAHHIRAATVNITYGRREDNSGALHELSLVLDAGNTSGQVQFFADAQGTQSYDYEVNWVYEPDQLIGDPGPDGIRSRRFEAETERSITLDLEVHTPVKPVRIRPGLLRFESNVLTEVQVRVAPDASSEGRTVRLNAQSSAAGTGTHLNVIPMPGTDSYFMRQTFFLRNDSTTIDVPNAEDSDVLVNEPGDVVYRISPQFVDPYALIDRVLVDAVYSHNDGDTERATLEFDAENPGNEFAVVKRPGDDERWEASYRFVMKSGPPVSAPPISFDIPAPFVGLTTANLRVVRIELLDTLLFDSGDVLAVRAAIGVDPTDTGLPNATVLLRQGTTSQSTIVPGVTIGEPVQVAIEIMRRGQPGETSIESLSGTQDTLFVRTDLN